jgi:glutaconate CoA-transferase subunit B
MMVVAGARALAGARVCFVGIGLPTVAVALARRTVAPDVQLVYEAGVYGAAPSRAPLSIGDPCLVTGAVATMGMPELFGYYLQAGRIDVGFLGAAQIDAAGNLNTTVIGDDYTRPKVRLPGSGGACDIANNVREVVVLMRQSARSFVDRVDFVTSPGDRVTRVVTDLAVFGRVDGRLRPTSLHPGVDHARLQAATGWDLDRTDPPPTTPEPTGYELSVLRAELDAAGA